MRLLFIKKSLAWPRSSGHDIYTFYTMKALTELGHEVSFASRQEPPREAIADLKLAHRFILQDTGPAPRVTPGSWLQKRFRSYWGASEALLESVRQAVTESRADAVVVIGLDVLPFLPAIEGPTRVWFAADEMVRHHFSLFQFADRSTWIQIKTAVVMGLYERAHRKLVDRAWVVSEDERRAMRSFAGMTPADVVPLGVDSDLYAPVSAPPEPGTAIFWGRLDFGPNIQALQWFCKEVWPLARQAVPNAKFTILGFSPGPEIRALATEPGVSLLADVPDLREAARRHALVVLPMVSGGGVKNKLLEAAAMGLPIICTPLATQGLKAADDASLQIASDPAAFAATMTRLWNNEAQRASIGAASRDWVVRYHSWRTTGQLAAAALEKPLRRA